jgi:hypothetical protein
MKDSHCCEDKEEGEIDPHSRVKVCKVEPAGHMSNYVRNDGGQVLCQEGAQQVSVELVAWHDKLMAMCSTNFVTELDTLNTIIQHRFRSSGNYIPGHDSEK